jgi:hydroxymethylpyrimidine/phosphomethylpyrimidine kinase
MSDLSNQGRVLIIAGSDSSGGAGIQADIKTITKLGGYAASAITAITVQNTLGVSVVHAVPADIVAGQIGAVLGDIGADCIKLGMLFSTDIINSVADTLDAFNYKGALVLDPVMIATSGDKLIDDEAIETLKMRLIPRATVITPNVPEAEVLTGYSINTEEDLMEAGRLLLDMGAKAALMKGGHLMVGENIVDILVSPNHQKSWHGSRIDSKNTHGTGCTLASAVATGLAHGMPLDEAVERARGFVRGCLIAAPNFGKGNGPMGHHLQ